MIASSTAAVVFTAFFAYSWFFQKEEYKTVIVKATGSSALGFFFLGLANMCFMEEDPLLGTILLSLATAILYATFWLFTCKSSEQTKTLSMIAVL